jgi:hypothetical protein
MANRFSATFVWDGMSGTQRVDAGRWGDAELVIDKRVQPVPDDYLRQGAGWPPDVRAVTVRKGVDDRGALVVEVMWNANSVPKYFTDTAETYVTQEIGREPDSVTVECR